MIINDEERKQNNKNMLRSSLSAGGFALSILTAFTFITIGASYIEDSKKAKADSDFSYKQDAEDFIEALTYLGNKQYQDKIGVSTVSNYVLSISAIEYSENGLVYCANAQKHGLESSLIVINIADRFGSLDNCISTIKDNYMKKDRFNISSEMFKEETSEEAKTNSINKVASQFPDFQLDKAHVYKTYEAKSIFALSLTFKDNDETYCSCVKYQPLASKNVFNVIKYSENKTMFYALESLVNEK